MTSANEIQVGGDHYKKPIQHWDFAAANYGPGYFRGNATKYLVRWRDKNGIEDLKKARHYVQKLIEVDWVALGWIFCSHSDFTADATLSISDHQFNYANAIPKNEAVLITWITHAPTAKSLEIVLERLDQLIKDAVATLQVETLR